MRALIDTCLIGLTFCYIYIYLFFANRYNVYLHRLQLTDWNLHVKSISIYLHEIWNVFSVVVVVAASLWHANTLHAVNTLRIQMHTRKLLRCHMPIPTKPQEKKIVYIWIYERKKSNYTHSNARSKAKPQDGILKMFKCLLLQQNNGKSETRYTNKRKQQIASMLCLLMLKVSVVVVMIMVVVSDCHKF